MKITKVLTVSDIARELGISRQALYQRQGEKKLPPPDFKTEKGQPLWRRSTLAKRGILEGELPRMEVPPGSDPRAHMPEVKWDGK